MARKVYTKGLDDLERAFDKMGARVTPLMKKAVYAGAGNVADNVRASLAGAVKNSTGQLESGLQINRISTVNGDVMTSVGFEGYDDEGRPLPIIAAVLDAGRSDQPGRTKTGFFRKAVTASRKTALMKMREQFEKDFQQMMNDRS